jgi:acyl transferase domain-containing protein/acyl carrier protein
MTGFETCAKEPIAIIGMSGRFPGAKDVRQYWNNIRAGIESIRPFTEEELREAHVHPAVRSLPNFVNAGAVLEDIEWFDAGFFGINAREAESMDPQQRLLIETAWETLEDAGYDPAAYPGSIGVYAGARHSTYFYQVHSRPDFVSLVGAYQVMIGNEKDQLSNHVSYCLDLHGPSVNVQTACSTSLVAVGMACSSLWQGACGMALAGGVSIDVPQKQGYIYREGGINSPDGHCRAFDGKAAGMVGGNAVGLVLLKPMGKALADGDHLYAVIRGVALNNDGNRKVSYAAPSVQAQLEVIAAAHSMAGVDADTLHYVEAHGTGTAIGDPIEIEGLTKAFRLTTARRGFCALGSVKTNIGHCDPAAGIASLIKVTQMLVHGEIPPSLNFEQPNPEIDFEKTPFFVNTTLTSWPCPGEVRRAGVSAYGIGGTNAHVVLEEPPATCSSEPSRAYSLLTVSARSKAALDKSAENLAAYLALEPDRKLADVAYTCHVGRRAFPYRRYVVCSNAKEAIGLLGRHDAKQGETAHAPKDRKVVWLFPGQGAQYAGMGAKLYEGEVVFRAAVDLCSDELIQWIGMDLRNLLYGSASASADADRILERTEIAQPALFVTEYALARLWLSWGVQPAAMAGHSIGEYTAACLANVFTLHDALALIAARGRLMQRLPTGAMLAVPLPETQLAGFVAEPVAIAAVNAPAMTVASGPSAAIEELSARLSSHGISSVRLRTSHAFHSSMMDPILSEFRALVAEVPRREPEIPYISNLTGDWVTPGQAVDSDYWVAHLRNTVRFMDGAARLLQSDYAFVECGPGHSLGNLLRQQPAAAGRVFVPSMRSALERESDVHCILSALGRLWSNGVNVVWPVFHENESRRRVPLPAYPFERQKYWVEAAVSAVPPQLADAGPGGAKERNIADQFHIPAWRPTDSPPPLRASLSGRKEVWLVLSSRAPLDVQFMEGARASGVEVVEVIPGNSFAGAGDFDYVINPAVASDFEALMSELAKRDSMPSRIVDFWPVSSRELAAPADANFYSLLWLLQAISPYRQQRFEVLIVTDCLHAVTPVEPIHPEQATITGPCKVGSQEYPHVRAKNIDVALKKDSEAVAVVVDQLLAEVGSGAEGSCIAYRGAQRWVQAFEPMRIESNAMGPSRLRSNGVYLITGGLGGIGITFAEYLGTCHNAKLVLTRRSVFPPEAAWAKWLSSHDSSDPTSAAIHSLERIRAAGGDFLLVAVDATDTEGMRRAVAAAHQRFGEINGVIHSAGVAGGGIIDLKTRKAADEVLRPKIEGLRALDSVFDKAQLDFLVLCSSLASVVGGIGRVDYVSANAYLDAYALARSKAGYFTVSINWPAWRDVGMAVTSPMAPDMEHARIESLERGVYPQEGVEAFRAALSLPHAQFVVAPPEPVPVTGTSPTSVPAAVPDAGSSHPRPDLTGEYIAPESDVERSIAAIWEAILGVQPIGREDDFFELGGHSLLAVQVVSRIRSAFQVEIGLRRFFELPTVAQLAGAIEDLIIVQVEQLSDDEARKALRMVN